MSLQSDSRIAVLNPAASAQRAVLPDSETADLRIDVTGHTCPMTFVRTVLALDRLVSGQILAVQLRGEEAARSVPQAATAQGHAVLSQVTGEDGITHLLLRRK